MVMCVCWDVTCCRTDCMVLFGDSTAVIQCAVKQKVSLVLADVRRDLITVLLRPLLLCCCCES